MTVFSMPNKFCCFIIATWSVLNSLCSAVMLLLLMQALDWHLVVRFRPEVGHCAKHCYVLPGHVHDGMELVSHFGSPIAYSSSSHAG